MEITTEAIEAAAKTLWELSPDRRGSRPWADLTEDGIYKVSFRHDAREALQAAAPFLGKGA